MERFRKQYIHIHACTFIHCMFSIYEFIPRSFCNYCSFSVYNLFPFQYIYILSNPRPHSVFFNVIYNWLVQICTQFRNPGQLHQIALSLESLNLSTAIYASDSLMRLGHSSCRISHLLDFVWLLFCSILSSFYYFSQ